MRQVGAAKGPPELLEPLWRTCYGATVAVPAEWWELSTTCGSGSVCDMPLFTVANTALQQVAQSKFTSEKVLQNLVEKNLDTVFKCRLVATEFSTGTQHAGRIDTLALSEDDNPVIIEYKVVESSDLVNQSLFYLSWIHDHRGDFEIAAQRALARIIREGADCGDGAW